MKDAIEHTQNNYADRDAAHKFEESIQGTIPFCWLPAYYPKQANICGLAGDTTSPPTPQSRPDQVAFGAAQC